MLQPDLFFAYGLSSGLAAAGGKNLTKQKSPWVNKYFIGVLIWLSVFYIPQVLYLLFRFPAWESMFVFKDLADVPAWFISIYLSAVMLMGVAGFYVTRYFLKKGKMIAAFAQVGWSMGLATVITFIGWDGTGYKRLLYVGSGADWANNVAYPIADFFTSPVFHTLLWLEGLVLAPYVIIFLIWARQQRQAAESQ